MGLSLTDLRLIAAIQDGLPLDPRPYARVAEAAGLSEREVISRLGRLAEDGVIRRFGVVVHHHELGYRANAMVVWDVPDAEVGEAGRRLAGLPFVTLCYRRPRHLPDWPYNLFCMIHGRNRGAVEALVEEASAAAGLNGRPRDVLFSRRRFKQRGARYVRFAPKLRKAG
jgi:DNA-binding Lrp family transcriptional regulator